MTETRAVDAAAHGARFRAVYQASVTQGRFAVWWPAGPDDLRSREIGESAQVDVTQTDGTRYRLTR